MKKLQTSIKRHRVGLMNIRFDKDFQTLPREIKTDFYNALNLINAVEDHIIINHIIKPEREKIIKDLKIPKIGV